MEFMLKDRSLKRFHWWTILNSRTLATLSFENAWIKKSGQGWKRELLILEAKFSCAFSAGFIISKTLLEFMQLMKRPTKYLKIYLIQLFTIFIQSLRASIVLRMILNSLQLSQCLKLSNEILWDFSLSEWWQEETLKNIHLFLWWVQKWNFKLKEKFKRHLESYMENTINLAN